jgi:hypothetical protein
MSKLHSLRREHHWRDRLPFGHPAGSAAWVRTRDRHHGDVDVISAGALDQLRVCSLRPRRHRVDVGEDLAGSESGGRFAGDVGRRGGGDRGHDDARAANRLAVGFGHRHVALDGRGEQGAPPCGFVDEDVVCADVEAPGCAEPARQYPAGFAEADDGEAAIVDSRVVGHSISFTGFG